MMNSMLRVRQIALACTAAWALVACGGGGGGSSAGAPNATPSTGFSGQDASAPTATNNIATDGLNWINYRRSQIGMPALARNAVIDTAAQGHSDYQRINNVVTHDQTAGKTGYTGARLQDRLQNAGYVFGSPNAIGEVISATSNGSGFYMAEELITAIYHRFVIFEPMFREIGTGAAIASSGYRYFTADFASRDGFGPGIARGTLVTWPFNGQTQVVPNFFSNTEQPDPVPNADEVGYPISVHTNLDTNVTVTSFTVRPRGGSDLTVLRVLPLSDNKPAAAIIPLQPLRAATVYDVSFAGTVNGAAVTRSWSFTTR